MAQIYYVLFIQLKQFYICKKLYYWSLGSAANMLAIILLCNDYF
jgi:hypothetical protein